MGYNILRIREVSIVLGYCRTQAYEVIRMIKENYEFSGKLKGAKVRTVDLAEEYGLEIENIYKDIENANSKK
jgi:hypothetical protein